MAENSLAFLLQAGSATLPIIWLLASLSFLKMAANKACVIGLLLASVIAVSIWQMDPMLVFRAALEGGLFALLPILWVILAALFTYNLSIETGAIEHIREFLTGISGDRRIQALIIAWGFGGFLEAVAGFGTAVAVPAALLIALGFEAILAARICLLANTVAVAFGVIGIPVTTLAKVTDLPVMPLATAVVTQLTPFALVIPFLIVYAITKSLNGFKGVWLITLIAGVSFGVAQFVAAKYIGPELPAIFGSVIACCAMILTAKLVRPTEEWRFPGEQTERPTVQARTVGKDLVIAWAPYLLLLVLVLGTSKLVPMLNAALSQVKSVFLVYSGEGGKPLSVEWLLTPGTLVMISAVLGGLTQGASCRQLWGTLLATVGQMRKTSVTVISIVAMAKILGYSGMVGSIAVTLANTTGGFYPVFAPMIGALGTFITGSDTSANILFGLLQKQTALQIGIDPIWIAAANTSGACAGKMISPQSIAIATTATGLVGREGELLSTTLKYIVGFLLGLGVITYAFAL